MEQDVRSALAAAKESILHLRRQNELMSAQLRIVDIFAVAIMGPPSPMRAEPDPVFFIDNVLSRQLARDNVEKRAAAKAQGDQQET